MHEVEGLCEMILDPGVPLESAAAAYALAVGRWRALVREARAIDAAQLQDHQRAELPTILADLERSVRLLDDSWNERWAMEDARSIEALDQVMATMRAALRGR